jgi:hypothetical protein
MLLGVDRKVSSAARAPAPGARVLSLLLPSMALPRPLPVGYCPCGLLAVFSAPSAQPLGSVTVRKKHSCDGSLPFPANVIGDDPDGAVLGGVVAGEEAPIACACGEVVGGFVFRVEIAPIAGGVAIKEGGEEREGNGGGDSGSGDDAAEVVEHGGSVAGGSRRGKGRGHGRPRLVRREGLSACGLGEEILDPDPVPLLEDQGGDRGRVLRHMEGGAKGAGEGVPVPWGEGFELLQQGCDGGAIQGRIRGES